MGSIPTRDCFFEKLFPPVLFCLLLPPQRAHSYSHFSSDRSTLILLFQMYNSAEDDFERLKYSFSLVSASLASPRKFIIAYRLQVISFHENLLHTSLSMILSQCRLRLLHDFPPHGLPFEFTVHHPDLFSLDSPLRVTTTDSHAADQFICGMVGMAPVSYSSIEEPFLICLTFSV